MRKNLFKGGQVPLVPPPGSATYGVCVCVCAHVCVSLCARVCACVNFHSYITFTLFFLHSLPLPSSSTLLPVHTHRMVECIHCGREMHTVCVLHHENIQPDGFQCKNCLKAKHIMLKDNKFSAKCKLHVQPEPLRTKMSENMWVCKWVRHVEYHKLYWKKVHVDTFTVSLQLSTNELARTQALVAALIA